MRKENSKSDWNPPPTHPPSPPPSTTTTTPSGILAAFAILLDTTSHNHTHTLKNDVLKKNWRPLQVSSFFFECVFSSQTIRAFVVRNNSCTTKRMGRRKNEFKLMEMEWKWLANLHFLPSLFRLHFHFLVFGCSDFSPAAHTFNFPPKKKNPQEIFFRKGPVAQIVLLFEISRLEGRVIASRSF